MSVVKKDIVYRITPSYTWDISPKKSTKLFSVSMDEICETCDSVKDNKISLLKEENKKLKQLVEFYRKELNSLELKTALDSPAVPLGEMIEELTSTPEGKLAWNDAWQERQREWEVLVKEGKMSKTKYYRLVNGMDQMTLAEKLKTAQPNISRIEKPGYNVPTNTLKKLAAIFGVKVEELIGD